MGRPTKDPSGKTIKQLAKAEREEKAVAAKEDAQMLLGHAYAPFTQRPVNLLDPAQVEKRIKAYWASCSMSGAMPNPPGLVSYLRVSKEQFREWLAGIGSIENRDLATKTYNLLEQTIIDFSLAGKLSPQTMMFLTQNWFGYQNKNSVELQQAAPAVPSLDKLAAEAAALPDGDVVDADFVEIESGGKKQKGAKK